MKKIIALVARVVVVMVGGGLVVMVGVHALTHTDTPTPQSCTLGIEGGAVYLTVQGPTAHRPCRELLRLNENVYPLDASKRAGEFLVCSYKIRGNVWAVYDTGLAIRGTLQCDMLKEHFGKRAVPAYSTEKTRQ